MKIYTRTGDQGTTSLFGGKRVSKAALRIESYGTIDELNSWIGVLRDQPVNAVRKEALLTIQDRLFTMGSMLATEPGNAKVKIPLLADADVSFALSAAEVVDPIVIKYLNRLSDYLFVLSRKITQELNVEESPWKPKM